MVYFAVITKTPKTDDGNRACKIARVNPKGDVHVVGSKVIIAPITLNEGLFTKAIISTENTRFDFNTESVFFCSVPVFTLGEILIMDSSTDRTIPDGRKPDKWDVEYETFNRITDAVKCAKGVHEA